MKLIYKSLSLFCIILAFLLIATPAQPVGAQSTILYAKPTATGTGDCSSWANACTLQTALADAVSGDEIWVMMGTHKPTTGTDRTITFELGVEDVYGGFDGTETLRDDRDPSANPTILSGDLLGNDNEIIDADEPTRADNSYHVVDGLGSGILDGFTIANGNANGNNCASFPVNGCGGG